MTDKLGVLLADGVIDEVLGRRKSGKEANISLVRRGGVVIAAKVYKDRSTRSFSDSRAKPSTSSCDQPSDGSGVTANDPTRREDRREGVEGADPRRRRARTRRSRRSGSATNPR
jgi:hypothetical protein